MRQPKYIRIYDNKGETFDQFTVVFTRKRTAGQCLHLGMSDSPRHPQGFGNHGSSNEPIDYPTYSHLGKKVKWDSLTDECKEVVTETYNELWEVTETNKKDNLFKL